MISYHISEKFKSPQGEGVYAGTPMAFIRFVGCSVGKTICQHCDTDFDQMHSFRGGGTFHADQLAEWARPYEHICLTGGEPLDQDLEPLLTAFNALHGVGHGPQVHIETSGTKNFDFPDTIWVCVSPKPGFLETAVMEADEIKVIVPGLGTDASLDNVWLMRERKRTSDPALSLSGAQRPANFRWPGLEDALRWASAGKTVFLQPRNGKFDVDANNLRIVLDTIAQYPQLRVSTQLHKILRVQ